VAGTPQKFTVEVRNFEFVPKNLTIGPLDTVEWQWTGSVAHTSTSDAESGPDSWNSGLLNAGDSFQVSGLSVGTHPYYCIPHGGPGGVGMSGTLTVLPECDSNNMVLVHLTFNHTGGSAAGFEVWVDSLWVATFGYEPGGETSVSVPVSGDGQNHLIEIKDKEDPTCALSTQVVTPDCTFSPPCQMTLTANQTGTCVDGEVAVTLTLAASNTGVAGFDLFVDSLPVSLNPIAYDTSGVTQIIWTMPGDGQSHLFEVRDRDSINCVASASLLLEDCSVPCSMNNLALNIAPGAATTHHVEVRDFEFVPKTLSVQAGDIVRWEWTGSVAHTSTSDTISGPDAWNSGLKNAGDVFERVIHSEGTHPYYCIPHGGPGGVGMSGVIEAGPALPPCDSAGNIALNIQFEASNGSMEGFGVWIDSLWVANYAYSGGLNTLTQSISGDGQNHLIEIRDLTDTLCTLSDTIFVPACEVPVFCELGFTVQMVSGCDANNEVGVDLALSASNTGTSGFNVWIDSVLYAGSPFPYQSTDTTHLLLNLTGNDQWREIVVADVDSTTCWAADSIFTPQCGVPCEMSALTLHSTPIKHRIEVRDFEFSPNDLDVVVGDTIQFVWVGLDTHTVTSDAMTGPDVWDSGLLGPGAVFEVVLTEPGAHPYHCMEHGGPGGVGMSGIIRAHAACKDGLVSANISFNTTNGSSTGYRVFWDGAPVAGPLAYQNPAGENTALIQFMGDGASHWLTVQDMSVDFCARTVAVQAPECPLECGIENLTAATGADVVHIVEIHDFEFVPAHLTVHTGETVRFVWKGVIPHSTTSDATTDPDSWDSGVQPPGHVFEVVIQTPGAHPYYCIPHGGPGGAGMSGVITALENCASPDDKMHVEIQFDQRQGSDLGYNVFVDGVPSTSNPFSYDDPKGHNTLSININGDGEIHFVTIQDTENDTCAATVAIAMPDCGATCAISELTASLPPNTMHIVEVKDFEFVPKHLSIRLGDTVRYVWKGLIEHTVTSDTTSGPDAFNSGLFGMGTTYDLILTTPGVHPYYCIPHGGPGGVGMSGTVAVEEAGCQNGVWLTDIFFRSEAPGVTGFEIKIDGTLWPGGPFAYAPDGNNAWTLPIPGDGNVHEIIAFDADDVFCADTTTIFAPKCDLSCALSIDYEVKTVCDSLNNVVVEIALSSQNAGSSFQWKLDNGAWQTQNYDSTGVTLWSLPMPGDGLPHALLIEDLDSLGCTVAVDILTPDCTPDCQLTLSGSPLAGCDDQGEVPFLWTIENENGSPGGFNFLINDVPVPGGPFSYEGAITTLTQNLPGNGSVVEVIAVDVEKPACADTLLVSTPLCGALCEMSDLDVQIGAPKVHEVEVRDFEFVPKHLTINLNDTVRFVWTGVIPHTSTSDATTGADVWNSGLQGQGASFEIVLQTPGVHPYYCIPHGAPGGIGMSGTITVEEDCDDGQLNIQVGFAHENEGFGGFNVYLDGALMPGSPMTYAPDGYSTFDFNWPAEGQSLQMVLEDVDDPSCQLDSIWTMPHCGDPCFGFTAGFDIQIDHPALTAQLASLADNATQWTWTFGTGDTLTTEHPTYVFPETGSYEICLTVENAEGCSAVYCDTFFIGEYLCEARFEVETDGLTVHLTDNSLTTDDITQRMWSFGNNFFIVDKQNPVYTYDSLGYYEICLRLEAGDNCMDTACVWLDLTDPCLPFRPGFSWVVNDEDLRIQLLDQTEGAPNQWLWGFGDGFTSNEQNPEHAYDAPGEYHVCLLVQDTLLGCNRSYCEVIQVGTTGLGRVHPVNQLVQIYPNPSARGNRSWRMEGILEEDFFRPLALKTYDAQGRTLFEATLTGAPTVVWSLPAPLPVGIYFVELKSEKVVYRGKIVVQ